MKKRWMIVAAMGLAGMLQAEVLYEADFTSGYTKSSLVGQKGWIGESGKPSPEVWSYGEDGWAVVGKGSSKDAWARLTLENVKVAMADILVLEVTLRRGVPNSTEGSGILFGFGAAGAFPATLGANNEGLMIRGGFLSTMVALKADGTNWGDQKNDPQDYAEHQDKIVLRSVWNLRYGTGTLEVKNLTRGETKFTPLYFDEAQTLTTASLGDVWEISSWNQVFLRFGGSSSARIYKIKISR